MPKIEFFQSLWAMELRRPDGYEWSQEERFEKIAKAGFHGICLDPTAKEIDENLALKPLFQKHNLRCLVNAFPYSNDDLKLILAFAKEMGAPFVNVIGCVYPLTVSGAAPIIYRWLEIADEVGIPILFETHRECITNDMFFTLQLLDSVPEMRICADFSHYVLNRELRVPLTREWASLFDRLIARSDCFQGRIANREQIQVPIHFPQHQEWVTLFKDWWRQGFKEWRSRASDDDTLIFLCELGPPPYAITDANGAELSDRFEEAMAIRSWAETIWNKIEQSK